MTQPLRMWSASPGWVKLLSCMGRNANDALVPRVSHPGGDVTRHEAHSHGPPGSSIRYSSLTTPTGRSYWGSTSKGSSVFDGMKLSEPES